MIEYNIQEKGNLIRCIKFDSILEQSEYIKDTIFKNKYSILDEVDTCDDFFGKRSLKETINGMRYGFNDNTQYFLNSISNVTKEIEANDGMGMDVEGYAFDMFSVINNIPECCLMMTQPSTKPYIKIMVDIVFSAIYTAEEIQNRGIAITNLINTLLLNGCIVELYFMELNVQSDMNIMYTVKIDTDVLPISNIAFMCTPEYFRKIGFITVDTIRDKESEPGRGKSKLFDFMVKKFIKDKIFFIGGSFTNSGLIKNKLKTVKIANKYILELFKKYCEENKIIIDISDISA